MTDFAEGTRIIITDPERLGANRSAFETDPKGMRGTVLANDHALRSYAGNLYVEFDNVVAGGDRTVWIHQDGVSEMLPATPLPLVTRRKLSTDLPPVKKPTGKKRLTRRALTL